jgi:hypothetical protein
MTINDPTGRLARWAIYIQAYTFDIIHRPGKKHANVDILSRQVLLAYEANAVDNLETVEVEDSQEKTLDPWDDEYFLYFMMYKKHKNGSSKTQVKRIEKQAQHFKLVDDRLFYRKDTDDDFYALDYPKQSLRNSIAMDAHIIGHFQAQTTYDRLKDKYYWKNMMRTIKDVIDACAVCIRHQKKLCIHQKAFAILIKALFERIGIDLVKLPKTKSGYNGAMVITEYLTKYAYEVPFRTKTAEEISRKLWVYISMFSPPKIMVGDKGTEFVNNFVMHVVLNIE